MSSAPTETIAAPVPFDSTRLYDALPLVERASLQPSVQPLPPDAIDRAERAARRWREEAGFADDAAFAVRLEQANLTPAAFLALLGAKDALTGPSPERFEGLAACIAAVETLGAPSRRSTQSMAGIPPRSEGRFLMLVEPLLRRACLGLLEQAQAIDAASPVRLFEPMTVDRLMVGSLLGSLANLLHRTLILELNVARVQGRLSGDTPEARFDGFIEWLSTPDAARAIFEEYPALLRQVVTQIEHWEAFSREMLGHLCEDWAEIVRVLRPAGDVGLLTEVKVGAGDTHRRGRSVTVLRFESGWRVVYKPRSLAVDAHFNALLDWLNAKGAAPRLRPAAVLDRGDRGWQEFVAAAPCADAAALDRFYERQGAYLALFHALEASDFHKENLIAAGEHPMPIDLEALFHPRVEHGLEGSEPVPAAAVVFNSSALRVGLLPQQSWSAPGRTGVDMSGLGGAPGQWTPDEMPRVDAAGTDEMKIVRRRVQMWDAKHRPRLEGQEVNVLDHTETLVRGFQSMYRLLAAHRDALTDAAGPLAAFADVETRVVLRPTRTYALLLMESQHPDLLRSALDRDRFFDRLWIDTKHRSLLGRVIVDEQADLRRGDVPVFTSRPGSRHVWTSDGRQVEDLLKEPSLDAVRRRFAAMDDDDLERQCWFIRASMATMSMGGGVRSVGHAASAGRPAPAPARTSVSPDELLQMARDVGDRLETLALRDGDEASWVGITLLGESWSVRPLDGDLYSGVAGVALFLGYLGELTGERRYADLGRAAIDGVRRQLKAAAGQGVPMPLGGFSGLGGAAYVMSHLAALWRDGSYLDDAEALLGQASAVDVDDILDIIGGAAGLLLGAASLTAVRRSEIALDVVERCARRLTETASAQEVGVAWNTRMNATRPLLGMSHGASGMAIALAEAARLTGRAERMELARAAAAYERSRYSRESLNWPDYRILDPDAPAPAGDRFMNAWCHGAPGIGLARVRLLQHGEDAALADDLYAAGESMRREGLYGNHSLCHGDLGNAELLLGLSHRDGAWTPLFERTAAAIVESARRFGWRCGIPTAVESPGFMAGLSGIGYGFLRLADPARVPSVLTLEAPRDPAA